MDATDILNRAMAARTAQGLTVETTGIADRPEPFVAHFADAAKRDAYMARCAARGETCRIVSASNG